MSIGPKRSLEVMIPLAEKVVERLRPFCQRIEIAGSLRRRKVEVGDIELVAVPIPVQMAIDGRIRPPYLLTEYLEAIPTVEMRKSGPKYHQFIFQTARGRRVKVDLFLQPDPATWGQNFLLRTGSGDFSKWMVTSRARGGAVPVDDRGRPLFFSREARWLDARTREKLPTPEERDVFELLGVPFVPPEERENGLWRMLK